MWRYKLHTQCHIVVEVVKFEPDSRNPSDLSGLELNLIWFKKNWSDPIRTRPDPRSNDLQSIRNLSMIWKNTIHKLTQFDPISSRKSNWSDPSDPNPTCPTRPARLPPLRCIVTPFANNSFFTHSRMFHE
jgi:hypothetical protein